MPIVDWKELLTALGGGASAVLILLLLGAVIALWKRTVTLTDARFEDHKEHTRQMREISDSSSSALNSLTRVVEDRLRG